MSKPIVGLYEDDNSIWKLHAPLPNLDDEPYLGVTVQACP